MEDYLITETAFDNTVNIIAVETTDISKISSESHKLYKGSGIILAKTITATLLMSSFMKNERESLTLEINGNGDFGKIVSVVNSKLDVKGYIENTKVDFSENLNVGNRGYIKVIKDMGLKEPYVGVTNLVTGDIGEDVMYYCNFSEQIISYMVIDEVLDENFNLKRIGGMLIRVMPGIKSDTINYLKKNMFKFKLFKDLLTKGNSLEDIIIYMFGKENLKFSSKRKCEYRCSCSREKMKRGFISLGKEEIKKIIKEDGKASLECHFCGRVYILGKRELEKIVNDM